jgi:hypothetical protein
MSFEPGQRVSHKTFGPGTVLRAQPGGANAKVTVSFDASGERAVLASFLAAVALSTESELAPSVAATSDTREGDGVLLLYRHKRAAPIGHSVHRLHDASVLALFRRLFAQTRAAFESGGEDAVHKLVRAELGAAPYGFTTVFTAACQRPFALPETDDALYRALLRDLYVECAPPSRTEFIRMSEGALCVRTDDDEVDLAYALVPEALVREDPARWAWWSFAQHRLPDQAGAGGWRPSLDVRVRPLPGLRDDLALGVGRTWVVLLTSYDSDTFGFPGTFVLEGVRVPDLGRALREARPAPTATGRRWPYELRLLRAMVAPDERDIGPAIQRCAEFPVHRLGGSSGRLGEDANHRDAFDAFVEAVEGQIEPLPRARSKWAFARASTPEQRAALGDAAVVDVGAHHAALFTAGSHRYFDQWIVFDDRWASANPALAEGLLVFATSWDPRTVEGS